MLAAFFLLSIYLLMRGPKLAEWNLFKAAASVSLVAGMGIYALAWISAWPPKTWVPYRYPESGANRDQRWPLLGAAISSPGRPQAASTARSRGSASTSSPAAPRQTQQATPGSGSWIGNANGRLYRDLR